ncbi:hypothetical protein BN1723_005747 [Verticillium longisporum]|uniref:Uncharacterized protein n=1 Tax=Verticillium longisporum TaxID=100787 RepID=A0A0G4N287_VERLO|nr:hypothetical protein BN1708_008210 [Verticillium longisporum]CRK43640.1 hypothetical protein BN1723_005747 [Verticillium longisporum]
MLGSISIEALCSVALFNVFTVFDSLDCVPVPPRLHNLLCDILHSFLTVLYKILLIDPLPLLDERVGCLEGAEVSTEGCTNNIGRPW